MEKTLLTCSVENWITVILMVTLGYLLFALIAQVWKQYGPSMPTFGGGKVVSFPNGQPVAS